MLPPSLRAPTLCTSPAPARTPAHRTGEQPFSIKQSLVLTTHSPPPAVARPPLETSCPAPPLHVSHYFPPTPPQAVIAARTRACSSTPCALHYELDGDGQVHTPGPATRISRSSGSAWRGPRVRVEARSSTLETRSLELGAAAYGVSEASRRYRELRRALSVWRIARSEREPSASGAHARRAVHVHVRPGS